MAAANLIPGPNSTELAMHIGFKRAGWKGFLVSGICFILPAMFFVIFLTYFYKKYGGLPLTEHILFAIKPVIIGIILKAVWSLGRRAVKGKMEALLLLVAVGLYFVGVNEIIILFGCGFVWIIYRTGFTSSLSTTAIFFSPAWLHFSLLPGAQWLTASYHPFTMFLEFVKIGGVLYGSGYVLLAFLESSFVNRLGWITVAQLLDVVAIGQVTPGPLFTSATSIGYLLGGWRGAIATLGIFLPAFIFVAISIPLMPRLRQNARVSSFLDGVNIASLALMAGVSIKLAMVSLFDPITIAIFLFAAILLFRSRVNPTWLILGGALIGMIQAYLV